MSFQSSTLNELEELAKAAGYHVLEKMEQVRKADPRYQIGSGKVEELVELVKETGAQKIIFDNRLKPLQTYNLVKATGKEVIDRFQLILEIFFRNAKTREAKFQIRLAQLKYELTHAKEKVRLAKKEEQPGFMGLGAYGVDVYYESIKKEIQTIRKKLEKIRKQRRLHRQSKTRRDLPKISLAGYTNSGKSSLFNVLTDENVLVKDELFTTLSTKTKLMKIQKKRYLLTDTVGFIDRLPLTLIEAFNSTLEETVYSDLIILMIDLNEPLIKIEKKISCCLETINQIGATGIPIISVLNKIDLLTHQEISEKTEKLVDKTPKIILVSALKKRNIDQLEREIEKIFNNDVNVIFSIPVTNESMAFISKLFNELQVNEVKFKKGHAFVSIKATPAFVEKTRKSLQKMGGIILKN